MKGTEVIELFEKHGFSAHAIVSAVYGGLYPDFFGVRLKPFNCLTCEYAEPGKRPNDPGACRSHCEHQSVSGISYCPHTPGGEPNAMVWDDGIEGTCKYGYAALRDIDFFERLKGCEFVRGEVEEYFDDFLAKDKQIPIAPRPVDAARPNPLRESESDETEPGRDQQVEDQEPTNAVPYIKWRRAKVGSIHDGQLMLEVQDRWGRPPKKTLDRAKIAALVLGLDPPTVGTRESLENSYKNTTRAYKKMLKK